MIVRIDTARQRSEEIEAQHEPVEHTCPPHIATPKSKLANRQSDRAKAQEATPPRHEAPSISHELRTSLAIITLLSGNLDLLYERLEDDERRRMIRDIRKHTQKVNTLMGRVLELCNDHGLFPT